MDRPRLNLEMIDQLIAETKHAMADCRMAHSLADYFSYERRLFSLEKWKRRLLPRPTAKEVVEQLTAGSPQ